MDHAEDRSSWDDFRSRTPGLACVDRFEEQLHELFQIDHPEAEPKTPAFADSFRAYRENYFRHTPAAHAGVWAYFSWKNTAMRVLPRKEFYRVRTARNRNIITATDQQKLRRFVVGIAGLSIGNSIAVSLALQGGAETIVLADHDTLALSNLNRLNMPLSSVGENKAVITARQIYELNPFSIVILFPEGLNEHNLARFLLGAPKLDVVVEEIDSLEMKWKIRESARAKRIPVLMATCMGERVLLDVERYDELPGRRLFVRDVGEDFLERVRRPLSRAEWMRAATTIVGEDDTLPDVAATNAAIGVTVTTRPLLGSTATAAGTIAANAIRALAVGLPLPDGRQRHDLLASSPSRTAPRVSRHAQRISESAGQRRPDITAWERALAARPPDYWEKLGESRALKTFQFAAARVPAYRDFLRKHKVQTDKIKTIADFKQNVPFTDKDSYLRSYPLEALCLDGSLHHAPMISVSSGSSGKSFFWPRSAWLETEGAFLHELIFRNAFNIQKRSTLVVIGFSMGTWIAGTYTKACVLGMTPGEYRLNVATPGIEIEDIVNLIEHFSGSFDQIVLAGYPPFSKDVVEALLAADVKLPRYGIRFLFAGEGFSEGWREALLAKVGHRDRYQSSINLYGTADAAVCGHETPTSIAIRRWLHDRNEAMERLFDDERLPTLVQYHPYLKYFETIGGDLAFTARAGFPLVRYNIRDRGGILPHADFMARLSEQGMDLPAILREGGYSGAVWKLPFMYLFGRAQAATTIYAVNIYLENIQAALSDPELRSVVSGKSVMGNGYDDEWDQYWWVKVEAARGVTPGSALEEKVRTVLVRTLTERNSEFRRLHAAVGDRALPRVTLLPPSSPEFHLKIKHRWAASTTESSQNPRAGGAG